MWRDSGLAVKFFGMDGICFAPMLLFLFHMSTTTLYILLGVVIGVQLLARRGLTPGILFLIIRRKIHGDYRPTATSLRTVRRRARW